jgi:hypothetical protein
MSLAASLAATAPEGISRNRPRTRQPMEKRHLYSEGEQVIQNLKSIYQLEGGRVGKKAAETN